MDLSDLVQKQKAWFQTGATQSLEARQTALKALYETVKNMEGDVARALEQDLGKAPCESYLCETGLVLHEIRYHLAHVKGWMRARPGPTPWLHFPARSEIRPRPLGVSLIISPWNYPFHLCLMPLIGALSAGCCAVVKPSEYAPATAEVVEQVLKRALPQEQAAVVQGGREETEKLLEQPFDHIFFTGSQAVGKAVMAAAAKNLTPVTLELGGKSPVILDHTADLKTAARRIAFGKVLNAGQTCVAPDYLLLEQGLQEEFLVHYRAALEDFFPGGDLDQMARIVSRRHFAEKKALLAGQNAAIGGGWDEETGKISPTVLVDVDPASPVMQEEIFAPILPVIPWQTLDEAIAFVQERPRPLALYLFTGDKAVERRVLGACDFGGGCVNDTIIHLASPGLPFGGVGPSGMGQYHGKYSFDAFSHPQAIVHRGNRPHIPVRDLPYTKEKERLARWLLK